MRSVENPRFVRQVEPKTAMPYAVWLPPGYAPGRPWPALLFLHGAGERGNDGMAQTRVGIGPALLAHPGRYPAVVVLPQCPRNGYWAGSVADAAVRCLVHAGEQQQIDGGRLYVTGISMGGFGSLYLAARHPTRFAAVVPICGGTDPTMIRKLREMPIWVFHGEQDEVVPVEYSRTLVAALRSEGAPDIRYTEYLGIGHNSWDRAYDDPALAEWLFAQSSRDGKGRA